LTTAILFHQLFEGLSLGIRIASLPPKDETALEDEEDLRSPPLSDPGAPSNSTLPSRSTDNFSSQGGVQPQDLQTLREREVHWLKPTLSILFAVTTPFGMCVGMILWKNGSDSGLFFYYFT
jgi:zinc transporter 1/2/3